MAAKDLNPCVARIVCALTGAARTALSSLLTAARGQIEGELQTLYAQLAQYDATVAVPFEMLRESLNLANQGLDQVQRILPIRAVNQCGDLGGLAQILSGISDRSYTQDLAEILDDAERALSIRAKIQETIQQLESAQRFLDDLLETLDLCV